MGNIRKRIRNGKAVYSWRATVPFREADGRVTYREVERGTGAVTLAEAREKAKLFEREYHDALDRPPQALNEFLFCDAAKTYVESGGEGRFLRPIVEAIGTMPVSQIDQDTVNALARQLYPGCAAGTINRQVFSPVLAVLGLAAKQRRCPPPVLARPKGHEKAPTLELPDEAWFDAILPVLSAKMQALVLLLTLHGLRVSEAIERVPADIDTAHWILSVPDSKTGEPFQIRLAEPVIEAIKAIPRWREQKWLFGTASRTNIARALRDAAKKAGVKSYGTHALGRHSFASRILRAGKSLKFLKDAGRWKTIKMPAQRYGHLEKSEVNEAVNDIAGEWAGRRAQGKIVAMKVVK